MAVWIALALFGALVAAGLAFAGLRGFQLYRQVKRAGAGFGPELERIAATGERIQQHLERAERSQAALAGATGRLAASRGRLQVQLDALNEARRALNTILPLFGAR